MKIKMIHTITNATGQYISQYIYNIEDAIAKEYVKKGWAEIAKDETEKMETTEVEKTEKKVVKKK